MPFEQKHNFSGFFIYIYFTYFTYIMFNVNNDKDDVFQYYGFR